MKTYMVVGVYEDNFDRFAEDIEAENVPSAEEIAEVRFPSIIVAAIIDKETGEVVR